jgi:hypothetical protein
VLFFNFLSLVCLLTTAVDDAENKGEPIKIELLFFSVVLLLLLLLVVIVGVYFIF